MEHSLSMTLNNILATTDMQKLIREKSCKYTKSRDYRKAMAKIKKESGTAWVICGDLGVSMRDDVNYVFPDKYKAEYWSCLYIMSEIIKSDSHLICKHAEQKKELIRRMPWNIYQVTLKTTSQ